MIEQEGERNFSSPSKRTLGASGIEVTPIGLGAWQFSEGKGGARGSWEPVSEEDTDRIVSAALSGGINWFDTAELYGFGRSERGLARALNRANVAPNDVVIATKWYPILRTARSIKRTIPDRIEALEPYQPALHQIHFPLSFSTVEAEMSAMADLVDEGKIQGVGVSNFSAAQMERAHRALAERGLALASNQVKYSLLNRRIERNGILETARRLGISIIAYSPLDMGLLTGKFHRDPRLLGKLPLVRRIRLRRAFEKSRPLVDLLETIAREHDATSSQVALNWLVHFHGSVVVAIPGASKPRHAVESAAALAFALDRQEMNRIDELSRRLA